MVRAPYFPFKFTGRALFIGLVLIIVIHLVLFIYYTQQNKRAQTNVNRDIIIQQVINLIERINFTAPPQRNTVVNAVDISNLTVSLDKKPHWKLRFNSDASLWEISQAIRSEPEIIRLSLEYTPDSWLNISMPFVKTSWWMQIFLLTLEIVVVSSIIFSIWSINRFAAPLRSFKKTADRLGVDLDLPPLKVYGPAIVQETAYAMNQLQQRIRELIRERTNMLAALSHDLRTPITRMKLRAQFIEDKELQEKTITDLDQMEAMIAETLTFAKNDNVSEKRGKLDLRALLQSICDDFIDIGFPVTFECSINRVIVKGASISLRRAFNNVIENAVKYGKRANVKLTLANSQAHISIKDEGPGIPLDQLQKVFEPFYRGEASRSRETGGTGLGLSVTRNVIRSHHGQIRMNNLPSGGLEVIILLPLA